MSFSCTRRAVFCLILSGAFAFQSLAQTVPEDPAFERAKHLQHGINASLWFAQSPGNYGVERLRSFTTAEDFALLDRYGFDHVRLSVDADPLTAWQKSRGQSTPFMTELDAAVGSILDHHLAVILDIHPEDSYKQQLREGSRGVQQFAALWRDVAAHFAARDPERVFFEIMNEPEVSDPFRWQGIESYVAEQIRRAAPRHTLIATGGSYSGLDDLLNSEPVALPNVIYTFHDYEPFPFTHQGAGWTSPEVRPLRRIPYPATPESVADRLEQEPTLAGQYFVEQYGLGRWDAARVDASVRFAEMWSQQHHVPVYCGEFGVLKEYADPGMRAQWIHDMRVALERHHIGWAMWDYQANFGMVTKQGGKTVVDPAIVEALGRRP